MWLPKEIRQAAKEYGGDNLEKITHFIEGAKWVYEHYEIESWDGVFSRDTMPCTHGGIPDDGVTKCDIIPFEEYWNAYDKKVGKVKAEKLWGKLTNKEKRDCMAYVPMYVRSRPDKQYRKNPETFLRNKCWNDEIINMTSDNGTRKTNNATEAELDFFSAEAQRLATGFAATRAE